MDLAGEILKKRREDLGRDIQEIADLLKIRADYLRAIEEDVFSKLPAPVYTNGYIRCYARYLGIDADSIVEHYTKNLSQPGPSTIFPVASFRKKSPGIMYAVLLLVCAAVILVYFRYVREGSSDRVALTPAKPETVAAAPPMPAVDTKRSKEPAAGRHSLGVSAAETTWMYIKFGDDGTEEMLLRPGESRDWSFSERAYLKVGNAGGIRINLDGSDLGTPGEHGQVVTLTLPPR
jgi:cytoskeleton protein RodZ